MNQSSMLSNMNIKQCVTAVINKVATSLSQSLLDQLMVFVSERK